MMRNVGKKVTVTKNMEIEEVVVKEKITTIYIRPEANAMEVTVSLENATEQTVKENTIVLSGEDYDLLFSGDSIFDEGKQEGSYRETDLWMMIDKVSNE